MVLIHKGYRCVCVCGGGGGGPDPAFPLFFCKNPASRFLFISISRIQYIQFWKVPFLRSSQIPNSEPFFSDIRDPENTLHLNMSEEKFM